MVSIFPIVFRTGGYEAAGNKFHDSVLKLNLDGQARLIFEGPSPFLKYPRAGAVSLYYGGKRYIYFLNLIF